MRHTKPDTRKIVALTGWRSGIGKCIKETLDKEGYRIFEIEGYVQSSSDWYDAYYNFKEIKDLKHMHLWAMINCAGIAEAKPIMDINSAKMQDMFDINCLSILHSIQTFGKFMSNQIRAFNGVRGHIVNITSISALTGFSYHAHYCASKFAANGLSQVAAKELSKHNILVNCVCPGPTRTPMWEQLDREFTEINGWSKNKSEEGKYFGKLLIKRIGESKDTANVVKWLISEENTYMTGCNVKVCGGNLIG